MKNNLAYKNSEIPIGYASEYITDIPWDKHPAFIFSNNAKGYLDALQNILPQKPNNNDKISYYDENWNFNPYLEDSNSDGNIISFRNCPKEIINYEKFFVIYIMMNGKKVSTANTRYRYTRNVLDDLLLHSSLYGITTKDIINAVEGRNSSPNTIHQKYISLFQFYSFLELNNKLELPVDINKLFELSIKAKRSVNTENSKFPDIPKEYFKAIRKTAISLMRNNDTDYNERATACELILLMELGMRTNDLLALKTSDLKNKQLIRSGQYINFIHYKAKKPSKAYQPLLQFDIFCTKLCLEAFNTLKAIRQTQESSKENDYLYILENYKKSYRTYPLSNRIFRLHYIRLIEKYLPEECSHPWGDAIKPLKEFTKPNSNQILYIPITPQYRVHLCSVLYNEKHVSLAWIQRYMGHLSEYMLGYYVRPKDTYQENIKYSEEVIQNIVANGDIPLGGDGHGKIIADRITDYIKHSKFNVAKDIDAIMKDIGDKVIIRGKPGGVCIKTSLMPCQYDARTNKLMCACDMCPNLFHFYYMIDISYNNFKNLQETYTADKARGLIRAAQKELAKCKQLITNRLKPEMKELESVIADQGTDAVIKRFPSLKEIIDKREQIKEEYTEWLNKSAQE